MMSFANMGRMILLLLCGMAGVYYLRYWYHNKNRVSRAASFLLICGAVLLIFSNAAAVPQPTTLLLRMITVATFHQGVLFIYFALDQFTREDVQQIYRTRLYLGTTFLSGVNLILEWMRQDNLGSFVDDQPYRPDGLYFASYVLFYGLWLFLSLMLLNVMLRFMGQNTLLAYRLRMSASLIWGGLFVLCAVLAEVNLGLSMIIGDGYRAQINALYHALKLPIGLFQLIGAAPAQLFMILARPLEAWRTRQQLQHRTLIHDLHTTMIRVVPHVHLPNEAFQDLRAPIEIEDARDVIWSHHQRTQPITPEDEAKFLHTLLQNNVILTGVGPHEPPATAEVLAVHNLKVARRLSEGKHSS